MLKRARSTLSFANVVAVVALFVALGGSAYAVTQIDRNSVESKHIVNDAVKGIDVSESTLRGVPVAGHEFASNTSASNSASAKSATATCPPGKVVVGAGGEVSGATQGTAPNITSDVAITGITYDDADSARATGSEIGGDSDGTWFVQVVAVCAKAP